MKLLAHSRLGDLDKIADPEQSVAADLCRLQKAVWSVNFQDGDVMICICPEYAGLKFPLLCPWRPNSDHCILQSILNTLSTAYHKEFHEHQNTYHPS